MIKHYLPIKNESATVPKFQFSLQLNTAYIGLVKNETLGFAVISPPSAVLCRGRRQHETTRIKFIRLDNVLYPNILD